LAATLSPAFLFFDSKAKALIWFHNADKWLHAVTFVALTVWFTGLYERRVWWLTALGLVLFGFLVEFCQLQVSYRTADWIDIAANTVGIIIGLIVAAAGLGGWGLRVEDWYSRRNPN
jgi:glycopeptide antibiotics resistance protein